ncbi:MAG TPA: hypothetical protein VJW20_00420 [Candidatus Angelobacter sp.]|nr:hypothetical protein [Candidatus Angelobacter sp.]
MKKLSLYVASFCLFFLLGSAAQAQQFDVDFGVSGLTGAPTNAITPTIGGGAYPSFGMDFLFYKNFGVGFNAAFRASQNLYQGFQPFRPFFYDVDAVYGPQLGKRAQAVLSAGIGVESIRFYTPFLNGNQFTGFTDFVSSNHFLGQFGGELHFYATNKIFIGPMAHIYLVHNNVEFSGARASRFGFCIGYSFKNQE